jgi:hypothetical protein
VIGLPPRDTRLSRATYADAHFDLVGPITGDVLDDAPVDYVAVIHDATVEQLRAAPERPPTPLLYRLLRHAALASYLGAARRALAANHVAVLEPEMIGMSTLEPPWKWLELSIPGGTIRQVLDAARTAGTGDAAFVDVWKALGVLATAPSRDLDALVREALDLCSHRLDAWVTGLAADRLRHMRAAEPAGIAIGAYGFVTNLVRTAAAGADPVADEPGPLTLATAPGGYIHTPSLAHTATAALLRSGHVAHRESSATTFATDLSSARVRDARWILDALREGAALGEILGRRIERALLDATNPPLFSFVPVLRELVASAAFAQRRTLDGYELVKRARAGLPWTQHGLPASNTPEAVALSAILAGVDANLDAIGDLLVAESVHQIAQGNPLRAAATLDALALGATPPADLGILAVPPTAIGLSHVVVSAVPAGVTPHGWSDTPRARAEPALEAWAGALLGAAAGYRVRVRYLAGGVEVGARELRFDTLGLGAIDVVRAAGAGELAPIILDHARTPPAGVPTSTPEIDPSRLGTARSLDDAIAIGQALAGVLARARAATAADLGDTGSPAPSAIAAIEGRGHDNAIANALSKLATDAPAGLRAAALLGVDHATPALDPSAWPPQVERARAALTARAQRLAALGSGTDLDARLARAVTRLELLYGDDLVILPPIEISDELRASLTDQAALVVDPLEPGSWLSRAALVRSELEAFDRAVFLADTIHGAELGLRVAQLPHVAGAPWIGRAVFDTDKPPTARRSFMLHAPITVDPAHPIAALLIDTWTEAVPAALHTTGVAFQIDQPTACPPQSILLAVPADAAPAWTDGAIEATVREALALAKLRAVDGDLIGDAGHYLPGLYFAINLAGDTASTDFTGSGT